MNQIPNIEERCEHGVVAKYCFRCKRPDLAGPIPNIEEWKKIARERLAPNVTYIDPKFKEVASWAEELLNAFWVEQQKDLDAFIDTIHHQIQKARQDWLRELKAVQRDFIARWEHPDSELPPEHTLKSETLYHLQTIIDRYQAELDQEVSK